MLLTLAGVVMVEAVEGGTRAIPFTCSYLPGRSQFHIALVLVLLVVLPLTVAAATFERDVLRDGVLYAVVVTGLSICWIAARWRAVRRSREALDLPSFDAEPQDRAVTLQLWDSRWKRA